MRILQINAVHRRLSTGRNMAELNAVFSQQGHTVCAAYSVGNIEEPEKDYLIGGKWGQKLHGLLSRLTGLQGYYSTFSTKKLLSFMDEWKPDVVLLNNLHANYIHLPKLLEYLAKRNIPTVAVLHDCWFFTGKCCHYTVAGCYRWQESCGKCPAKKKYNKSWLFDRSSKMLKDKISGFGAIPRLGVIAVSDWLLSQAKMAPVFRNAKMMERVYNWIDVEQFAPRDSSRLRRDMGLENKKVILCVASGWDNTKGLDTALQIGENLSEDEQMILVGGLPADSKLPERVLHIPKTDNLQTLIDLYNMADVFFQPSLEETYGKVSAEALACGTPVVCFRSTANPELIGPGCGQVVEPGDRDGALAAMRQIMEKGKPNYRENCRKYALANFEMEENCLQYLKFCKQLAEK